jgi:predicted GIY-YIG superfamily endonuclease
MRELIRYILREEVEDLSPDRVIQIASKYITRKDFRQGAQRAYRKAIQYNLFGNGINHLGNTVKRKPAGYWTFDKVKDEASKYTSRRDFEKGSVNAYRAAKQQGWYHDVTSDMDYLGSLYRRAVYAWEFPNNTVYIGLTDDTARREGEHLDPEGRTAVSKFIKETGLNPTLKIINDYTDVKDAQNIEKCSIDIYRSNGWNILNKAKAGGLGACKRIWTKENVTQEAKKYNTRSDFKKGNHTAYVISVREGWMNDITNHMGYKQIQWTEDMVKDISSKYDNLTDFLTKEPKAASTARRMGIYNDITKDMLKINNQPINWTPELIFNELSKHNTLQELQRNSQTAVKYAKKIGIWDEVVNYYGGFKNKDWTYDMLKDESSKYTSRFKFQQGNASAYQVSRRRGLLDKFFPK